MDMPAGQGDLPETSPQGEFQDNAGSSAVLARSAGLYVLAWIAVLLALALAEVWLDPDFDKPVGDALNAASVIVALAGALLVPIGVVAMARARQLRLRTSALIGAVALLAYALGTMVVLAIYKSVGGA